MIYEKINNDIFMKVDGSVIHDLNPQIENGILEMICVVDRLPYVGSISGFFRNPT